MISAHNRDVSRRKALRKRRIAREICGWEMYDNLHQYSKNKVHCSCPMCISDLKKVYAMENDLEEEGYTILRHRKRDRFT